MELMKIVFVIAITMALSVTLTMRTMMIKIEGSTTKNMSTTSSTYNDVHEDHQEEEPQLVLPSKRVSRFLTEKDRNPRAADHCRKDHEVCYTLAGGGKNSTCCNNKCVDLGYDPHNCGACKNKCKYTQTCCRGKCVDLAYDKRHCGECNHRCEYGQYCVYGLCNYA